MSLEELISRLQYLATFCDDPKYVRVYVVNEYRGGVSSIDRVEFTDEDNDLVNIVI